LHNGPVQGIPATGSAEMVGCGDARSRTRA
jgi:hypothetical protein